MKNAGKPESSMLAIVHKRGPEVDQNMRPVLRSPSYAADWWPRRRCDVRDVAYAVWHMGAGTRRGAGGVQPASRHPFLQGRRAAPRVRAGRAGRRSWGHVRFCGRRIGGRNIHPQQSAARSAILQAADREAQEHFCTGGNWERGHGEHAGKTASPGRRVCGHITGVPFELSLAIDGGVAAGVCARPFLKLRPE